MRSVVTAFRKHARTPLKFNGESCTSTGPGLRGPLDTDFGQAWYRAAIRGATPFTSRDFQHTII
jgi:hypothetical protein